MNNKWNKHNIKDDFNEFYNDLSKDICSSCLIYIACNRLCDKFRIEANNIISSIIHNSNPSKESSWKII